MNNHNTKHDIVPSHSALATQRAAGGGGAPGLIGVVDRRARTVRHRAVPGQGLGSPGEHRDQNLM